jgi:hypothetical protein
MRVDIHPFSRPRGRFDAAMEGMYREEGFESTGLATLPEAVVALLPAPDPIKLSRGKTPR